VENKWVTLLEQNQHDMRMQMRISTNTTESKQATHRTKSANRTKLYAADWNQPDPVNMKQLAIKNQSRNQ